MLIPTVNSRELGGGTVIVLFHHFIFAAPSKNHLQIQIVCLDHLPAATGILSRLQAELMVAIFTSLMRTDAPVLRASPGHLSPDSGS